jgi:hypothetical protein
LYAGAGCGLLAASAWLAGTRAARPLQLVLLLAAAADLIHALESPALHPARSTEPAVTGAACHRLAAQIAGPLGRHLSLRFIGSYALKEKDGELFSIQSVTHYEPLVTRRHALYFAALQQGGVPMSSGPWNPRAPFMGFLTAYPAADRLALLDLMGMRAILADGRPDMRPPALSALLERFERRGRCMVAASRGAVPVDVYENARALPRAFVVHRASRVESAEAALARMLEDDFDPLREAVVEGDVALAAPAGAPASVEFVSYGETRVALRVRSPAPGLLVLTDSFDAEWRASVDGEEAEVLPTDALFRGVLVPAGESEVVFRYAPATFWWGAALSALGAALSAGLWLRARRAEAADRGRSR